MRGGTAARGAGGGRVGGDDLGSVSGSLVGDTSCQQLAGNSKYSRVKAKGIGTIRVRAYATGPATKVSPDPRHHPDQRRQGQEGHATRSTASA